MKLVIVNGSPRGRKSNSDKIIEWPISEMKGSPDFQYEKLYAVDIKERAEQMNALKSADYILVIFPLYTDSMPGITKEFFEHMERNKELLSGKPIAFIIHSGFPEAIQSRSVERYTEYFSKLLSMRYMGSIVMAGSESLTAAPESMFRKKVEAFKSIGRSIAEVKEFKVADKIIISGPETLPKYQLFILKFLNPSNFYWNGILKKNNAFEKRLDKPYL